MALAALLGLPAPPVLSVAAVDRRLGRSGSAGTERGLLVAAFHRIRGHGESISFPRFRDTVLHEACPAMPPGLQRRVFAVWCDHDEPALTTASAGCDEPPQRQLRLTGFLAGVTIAWKGTPEEHLRFAYQLLDARRTQELRRGDALGLLEATARVDGIVAIAHGGVRSYTSEALADQLFSTPQTTLTSAAFTKRLQGLGLEWLGLIEWIPALAAQFQVEWERRHGSSSSNNNNNNPTEPTPSLLAVTLRRIGNGPRAEPAVVSPGRRPLPPTGLIAQPEPPVPIIQVESVTADGFQELKSAIHGLVEWALATKEPVSDEDIEARLRGLVSCHVVEAIRCTHRACRGEFFLQIATARGPSGSSSSSSAVDQVLQTKVRLFWWMLCISCAYSRTSAEVFRYLFVLYDHASRGYWKLQQLTRFLQCTTFLEGHDLSEHEAERRAKSIMDQIQTTELGADMDAPQPGGIHSEPGFRFRQFERWLLQHPQSGCSAADVDVIFTVFHINHACVQALQVPHRARLDALLQFCELMASSEHTLSLGLTVMPKLAWRQIALWVCDQDTTHALYEVLQHPNLCHHTTGSLQSPRERKHDEAVRVVALPLSLWLLVSRWGHQMSIINDWKQAVTRLRWVSAAGEGQESESGVQSDDSTTIRGFVFAVNLTYTDCTGLEHCIRLPHVAVHGDLTVLDVVQTILSTRGLRIPATKGCQQERNVFYCDGELTLVASDSSRTKVPISDASQDLVLVPIANLVEGSEPTRIYLQLNVVEADSRFASGTCVSADPDSTSLVTPTTQSPNTKHTTLGWSKVHGLANLGNTCFMNSAIQCLGVTPVLREYFLRQEHLFDLKARALEALNSAKPSSDNNRIPQTPSQLPPSSLLPLAFGHLLAELDAYTSNTTMSGVGDSISPKYMRYAIAQLFPHLGDGSQQDAQEFLTSFLNSLSDELRRVTVTEHLPVAAKSSLLSPGTNTPTSSPSLLARFALAARRMSSPSSSGSPRITTTTGNPVRVTFEVEDSDGRPDDVVAKEWWISHLTREPSIVTALFCGQFKSVLRCTQCGATSTRFEPFSSLQLPLHKETTGLSPRERNQSIDAVVILHFLDSPCRRPSRRLVLSVGNDWTISQLLVRLHECFPSYASSGVRRDHVAVKLDGFVAEDYIDPDSLLSTLSMPIDVFEVEYGDEARRGPPRSQRNYEGGDRVLVRASNDRWVRATIQGDGGTSEESYRVICQEGGCASPTCVDPADVRPLVEDRVLYLRFLHRRSGLVPFYSVSPFRLLPFGFPFILRVPTAGVTGRNLYRIVHNRFPNGDGTDECHVTALRRVRSDGKCCSLCHWSAACEGCAIDRFDEQQLELAMDETIAIDWSAEGQSERWMSALGNVDDDQSYVEYQQRRSHALEKGLELLCTTEELDARCAKCDEASAKQSHAVGDDQGNDRDAPTAAVPPNSPSRTSLRPHTKSLEVWSLPPILVIQLKRFELVDDGDATFRWQRLNHSVHFPLDGWDLSRFLAPAQASTSPPSRDREEVVRAERYLLEELQMPLGTASRQHATFRVYGLVHHIGDLGAGHYTAHIRHPESGDWWLVDDAATCPAKAPALTPSSSAYLLFFVRDDLDPWGPSAVAGAAGLPTPTEFFPRQNGASAVSDAMVRDLLKRAGGDLRWAATGLRGSKAPSEGEDNEQSCRIM